MVVICREMLKCNGRGGQGRAMQGRAGQGKAGQVWAGQGRCCVGHAVNKIVMCVL